MTQSPAPYSRNRLLCVAAVLLPAQALLLGGASQRWAIGVSLVLLGLYLVFRPPAVSLGKRTNWLLLGLVLSSAIALLPAPFSAQPEWQKKLGVHFEGLLPNTISPQPWLTAESVVVLLAGILWFYWVATLPLSSEERMLSYRLHGAFAVIFASLCLLFYWTHSLPPFWLSTRQFGPFPSRNLTGNVLALGGVMALACGIDLLRRRQWWGALFLAGLAPVGIALILNISRAAIGLFGLGVISWGIALTMKRRSPKVAAVALFAIIVASIAFFFSGTSVVDRFTEQDLKAGSLLGFRRLIYQDTLQMVLSSPWAGIGLGNYESVFPLFRQVSGKSYRVIHPESDWLWVLAEMGLIGVCLLGALVISVFPKLLPERKNGWSLDTAALIVIGLFLLHGLIDVSGHRLGSLAPALLIAGLLVGRHTTKASPLKSPWRWGFRSLGVVLTCIGGIWILTTQHSLGIPGRISVEQNTRLAREKLKLQQWDAVISASDRGLLSAPLDCNLYFLRGTANVGRHDWFAAIADFELARRLQPHRGDLAFQEGEIWLAFIPSLALPAWRYALDTNPSQAPMRFEGMLDRTRDLPQVSEKLREWARKDSRLLIILLKQTAVREIVEEEVETLLQADPDLKQFTPEQLRFLFRAWAAHDLEGSLSTALEKRADWKQIAWPFLARKLAKKGQLEEAYRLAHAYISPPTIPQVDLAGSKREAQQRWAFDKTDFASALILLKLCEEQGDREGAHAIIKSASEIPGAPLYFKFLKAEFAAQLGLWEEAWAALLEYANLPS